MMIASLNTISSKSPDPEMCRLAGDLNVCITTLGAVWSKEMEEQGKSFKKGKKMDKKERADLRQMPVSNLQTIDKATAADILASSHVLQQDTTVQSGGTEESTLTPLQEALQELKDPLIPVRGHALIALTKLVSSKDAETLQSVASLLQLFKENLCHSDSYVYLAAINGLVALALYINALHIGEYPDHPLPGICCMVCRAASLLTAVRDPEPLVRASSLSCVAEVCTAGSVTLTSVIAEVCML